ncbi:MAG: Blue-light-activated histidine kinase 1 [Novosphingobium sp.]|nr:Blue-light-activated histidine kinase 1 [Novosphingobium sp.]
MTDPVVSKRTRLGLPGAALLALAMVALGLVGGVALILSTIRTEQIHRTQAARSAELIVVLRDLARDTVNAETGQRGYFITLDRRYLTPYQAASLRYPQVLKRLKALTDQASGESSDPRRSALVAGIGQLTTQRFAELDRSVALIQRGDLNEARRVILSDEGQATMERLRLAVGTLENAERTRRDAALAVTLASEDRIEPLLLGLLVLILVSLGLALSLALRNADAEARAAHAADLAAARDRADLLAHEISHRVKNLFAVILALIRMSARDDPAAKPIADKIADRVTALLRAQELTQGGHEVELVKLVETVLAPYRSGHSLSEVNGPKLKLTQQQTTPLGLIFHELVTNCVKYGAWSQPGGKLALDWDHTEHPGKLAVTWREHCPNPIVAPAGRKGFGSTLLDGSMRQLSGELTRTYHGDGIEVRMVVPLATG